ncbi:MAG: signal peptidase I, partial [Nitrososphaerales archaeon]
MSEGKSQSNQKDRKNLLRATTYIIVILSIMSFIWLLPRVALGTDTPFFSVSSSSMAPTLNVGDYIVVMSKDKVSFDSLSIGDIIVFHNPRNPSDPNDIWVHRLVDIRYNSGQKVLITKGDANERTDLELWGFVITEKDYIGKYTGFKIPYLGYLALLFPPPINYI